jgi:hypothetical protein
MATHFPGRRVSLRRIAGPAVGALLGGVLGVLVGVHGDALAQDLRGTQPAPPDPDSCQYDWVCTMDGWTPEWKSAGSSCSFSCCAEGHAFDKHSAEFKSVGIDSRERYAELIDRIMRTSATENVRHLARDRTAYWDPATGTVVIHDREAADYGTAFRPRDGRTYFDALK